MNKPKINTTKILKVVSPTVEDIQKAKALSEKDCPRRYCWWWQSLSFDWETPTIDGCTFLRQKKPTGWKHSDIPCCRCDATSETDHYEPREPHLLEDGLSHNKWLQGNS